MSTINQSQLLALLAKFRKETARNDAAAIRQIVDAYRKIYKRLETELELEVRRIYESDNVSRAYITKRLSDLFEQVQDELVKFQNVIGSSIDVHVDDALSMGAKHAVDMLKIATLGQKSIIQIDFNNLPVAAIESIVGFLKPGSPLYKRIDTLGKYYAPIIRDQLVEAIALGYNPYKVAGTIAPFLAEIAGTFQQAMARPLADAVRMARTSMLYSYREANRANFQANSDVVSGWSWYANLDALTCPACISMHGTVHPLDEYLDGHYNCRCTPVPIVLGNPIVEPGAGQAWFEQQSAEMQKSILGPGAYQAYSEGKFDFDRLSKTVEDDVYGQMRVVTPLKELVQ